MIKLVCINTHIILKYVVNIVLTCLADLNYIIQEPGIRYALQFFSGCYIRKDLQYNNTIDTISNFPPHLFLSGVTQAAAVV